MSLLAGGFLENPVIKHQRLWTEIKWIAQGHTLCQGRPRVRTHSPQVFNLLLGSLNHKCLSRKKVSLELRQHSWKILTPKFKTDRISLDHRSITSFGGYTGEARGQGDGWWWGEAGYGWENKEAGEEVNDRGWDGWMASPTQWTWIWVNSGVGDGQRGLACYSPWGHKESDMTEWLNWLTDWKKMIRSSHISKPSPFKHTHITGWQNWKYLSERRITASE